MHIAQKIQIYLLYIFLSLADEYPVQVTGLHTQARLMGSFGLNGSFLWLFGRKLMLYLLSSVKPFFCQFVAFAT